MCVQSIIRFFKCGCCKKGADAAPAQSNAQNLQADASNDASGDARRGQVQAIRVTVAPAPTLQQQAQRGHHKYTSTMVDLSEALRTPMVEEDAAPSPATMAMS